MSFVIKVVAGFSGLGAVASIPLAITSKAEKIEFRLPPPVMDSQVMEKLMEEGACKISKGHRGGGSLYVCLFLNEKGDLTPSFFLLWRSSWREALKIQKIKNISSSRMQFDDGQNKPGHYFSPLWMKRGWDINPEKDCRRKEGSDNDIVCRNSSQEINIF